MEKWNLKEDRGKEAGEWTKKVCECEREQREEG